MTTRRNKYGSQKASFAGRTYDSVKECNYAQQLGYHMLENFLPKYVGKMEIIGNAHDNMELIDKCLTN